MTTTIEKRKSITGGLETAGLNVAGLVSYRVLREKVRETFVLGQQKIEQLKVRSYWDAGFYINEHVRLNGARVGYNKKILLQLSEDLEMHESVLRRMAEFAEKIPDYPERAARRERALEGRKIDKKDLPALLTWSHFRLLITVQDDGERYRLLEMAERHNWSTRRLEEAVWKFNHRKKLSADNKEREDLLTPRLGKLHTYRLTAPSKIHWPAQSGLIFDRGFKGYQFLSSEKVRGFRADEIVEVKEGKVIKSNRTAKDLFSYLSYVNYVIDGDTLWVSLDLGLGGIGRQKLRLRDIDAPEIITAAGKRAYEFLKAVLSKAPYLINTSYKNDKYDRYETDLFIPREGADTRDPAKLTLNDLVFINNLMLETGHAIRIWD